MIKKIREKVSHLLGVYKKTPVRTKLVFGALMATVLGGFVTIVLLLGIPKDTQSTEDRVRTVSVIPVSQFIQNESALQAITGSESTIRAETSGKIVSVKPVGSRVVRGAVIAEFDGASERALLLQAEGVLESAQASLEKVRGGIRNERLVVLETAFENSKSAAVTTLLSSYATVDSAVRDTGGQMFSNADSSTPQLSFPTNDSQRENDLENQRVSLGGVLERQSEASISLSSQSNLEEELRVTEDEVRSTRSFIDTLIAALNEAITTSAVTSADIASYKTAATVARTALTTSLTSLSSARASLKTAEQNLAEGLSGAEDTDVATAQATVKQTQGSYNAALATYQKTTVRAPSSGTIVSCSVQNGDVISVGSDVCRIRSVSTSLEGGFVLPLSSVKYAPTGALVFVVSSENVLEAIPIETGLVTAEGISVSGLFGDEFIVSDVRGLKAGDQVSIK